MTKNKLRGFYEVSLDGKTYPTLLNLNAFRLLSENEGIKLADFDKQVTEDPLGFIPRVLYWGAVNWCQRTAKPTKSLPSFDLWASFVCEDEETLAKHAESVAEVFGVQSSKEEEPGN